MANLNEKTVQSKAIELLRIKYNKLKTPNSRLFCRDEVVTKDGKRADGLLCFNQSNQNQYVVSLEAKSYKTLGAIVPVWNDSRLILRILLYSSITVLPVIYLTSGLSWYLILLAALLTIIAVGLSYATYSAMVEPPRHMQLDVLNQIETYPANEQWLAVSKDSLNLAIQVENEIKTDNEVLLKTICKKKGIGLIVVGSRSETIVLEPAIRKGEFLFNYAIGEQVKSAIDAYDKD